MNQHLRIWYFSHRSREIARECSGEIARPRSLARAFTAHKHNIDMWMNIKAKM